MNIIRVPEGKKKNNKEGKNIRKKKGPKVPEFQGHQLPDAKSLMKFKKEK